MDSREIDTNLVTLSQLVGRAAEVCEAVRGDTKLSPKIPVKEPQAHIQVNQDAHRRWRGSFAVDFISRVSCVKVRNSRKLADGTEVYILEVSLRGDTTLTVERSFSDFQVLRDNVLNAVSVLPICTCPYCVEFLLYIRFKIKQPRRITKLIAGTEKCKDILSHFMKDFIAMGKRRVQKIGKSTCRAQTFVPLLLEEFLRDASKTSL